MEAAIRRRERAETPVRERMRAFLDSEALILVAEEGQVVGQVAGSDIVRALLRA